MAEGTGMMGTRIGRNVSGKEWEERGDNRSWWGGLDSKKDLLSSAKGGSRDEKVN